MINFNKLNLTEGMDPVEQSAADKAAQSTDLKRDNRVRGAQQRQMAQKAKSKEKASVVYNEHKAMEVNRAYDRMKSDWRTDITEHRGAPAGEEEDTHPYVDIMPMTDQKEKRAKAQMDMAKKVGVENASKFAMGEEFDFETALGKLIDEAKETDNKAFQMVKAKLAGQLHDPSKPKPKDAPRNPLGDKKVPGMFDHSKRND